MLFKSAIFTPRLAAACAALILAGCAAPVTEAPLIPAKLLSFPKPAYPRDAMRNEQQGAVTLDLLIGQDGLVHDIKLKKSSGYASLDKAAADAWSRSRFAPATRGGKPVESRQPIQYVWTLD